MQTQLNHVIDMQNVPINDDQNAKQGKSSQPDITAPVYIVFVTSTIFYIIWSRLGDIPPPPLQGMHISSLYNVPVLSTSMSNNVYDSASRSSNSLPNLGGSVPGLQSTVGLSEYSSVHTIVGILDQTIWQGLQGEYVCLDEFLQNYTVNNTEVQDIQSYVDSSSNVAYSNKRQKRRVNSFNTWLEAWHNYERLLLSFHGFHLYDACTKYKLLMLSLDRKKNMSSLAILDMRHRLSLFGHSVQFDTIDSVLFSSIMDPPRSKLILPNVTAVSLLTIP